MGLVAPVVVRLTEPRVLICPSELKEIPALAPDVVMENCPFFAATELVPATVTGPVETTDTVPPDIDEVPPVFNVIVAGPVLLMPMVPAVVPAPPVEALIVAAWVTIGAVADPKLPVTPLSVSVAAINFPVPEVDTLPEPVGFRVMELLTLLLPRTAIALILLLVPVAVSVELAAGSVVDTVIFPPAVRVRVPMLFVTPVGVPMLTAPWLFTTKLLAEFVPRKNRFVALVCKGVADTPAPPVAVCSVTLVPLIRLVVADWLIPLSPRSVTDAPVAPTFAPKVSVLFALVAARLTVEAVIALETWRLPDVETLKAVPVYALGRVKVPLALLLES